MANLEFGWTFPGTPGLAAIFTGGFLSLMSDTHTPDIVQKGLTAARVGDTQDARLLLEEAVQKMPDNIEAWLGLAGVVESLAEKQRCFSTVLTLDPNNQEAQAGLTLVQQKLAAQGAQLPGEKLETSEPAETGLAYCYRHPDVETGLRCNRCNKPICPKCAKRTPVGFRCPDCIREQEDKYYSGNKGDYVIATVVALPLSLIAAGLFTTIFRGFFILWLIFIGIFVVPAIAGFIAEAVRWAVRKRRSRYLGHVVAASLILGTAPFLLSGLLSDSLFGLIAPGMFLFLGVTTVLARLR